MATTTGAHFDVRSLDRIRDKLNLEWGQLAATIGVDQSTLYRWRQHEAAPRPLALSRIAQLGELMQLLTRVFAGPDLARQWLSTSRPEMLSGKTPLATMTEGRIDRVLMVLHFLARGA